MNYEDALSTDELDSSPEVLFASFFLAGILVVICFMFDIPQAAQPLYPRGYDVVCSKHPRSGTFRVVETEEHCGNLLLSQICDDQIRKFKEYSTKTAQVKLAGRLVSCMWWKHGSRFLLWKENGETGEWAKLSNADASTAVFMFFNGKNVREDELPDNALFSPAFPNEPICQAPRFQDVRCGTKTRSILNCAHPGNIRVLRIIKEKCGLLPRADSAQWPQIIDDVMKEVMQYGQNEVSRFLWKNGAEWVELPTNDIMTAVFEMLVRIKDEALSPPNQTTACIRDFVRALPHLGAQSAVIDIVAADEVTSGFAVGGAVEVPDLPVALAADIGSWSCDEHGFLSAYNYSWPKVAVKKIQDLMDSGEYSHLNGDLPSPLSELKRILEEKPTGTFYIELNSNSRETRGGGLRASKLFNIFAGRNKSLQSRRCLKIEVQWYSSTP